MTADHGHPDHTGLAHALQQAGAEIWVHERDAAIPRDGPRSALRHSRPERSALPHLPRRPSATTTFLHLARRGAFTAPATPGVRAIDTDRQLDEVPGAPRAVPPPGHTPGSTGYFFRGRGPLFTGDALVTHDGLSGHTGPTLVCRGFIRDSRTALTSLDRLDELATATLLLPGHGQPLDGDPRTATRQARQTGPRRTPAETLRRETWLRVLARHGTTRSPAGAASVSTISGSPSLPSPAVPGLRIGAARLSPAPKTLLTLSGAGHLLGGISGYDAAETTDENPGRVAALARLTSAWLRTRFQPGDHAWQAAREALTTGTEPAAGRVESK